ncbi:MAG: hypothetical protein MZV64_42875 [Ignavibacteriales bacterium]|nr:hypothetical protein [Ignavibacteriales bacterium]
MDVRLHDLEPAKPAGYQVRAHEVKAGLVLRDDRVTVRAFAVPHGAWKQSHAYRFDTPGPIHRRLGRQRTLRRPDCGVQRLRHPGPRGLLDSGIRDASGGMAGLPPRLPHVLCRTCRACDESAARPARAVSPVVLGHQRRGACRRSQERLLRPGRVGPRPRRLLRLGESTAR